MWTSLPTALIAIVLLSHQSLAQKETTTIYACESTSSARIFAASKGAAASPSGIPLQENSNGEVYGPVASIVTVTIENTVTIIPTPIETAPSTSAGNFNENHNGEGYAPIVSTYTVLPVPVGTPSGDASKSSGSQIPSGIFWTGGASGNWNGTARLTGFATGTASRGHAQNPTSGSSKPTSVPFLSLNNTLPVPYPTSSSKPTTSHSIAAFNTTSKASSADGVPTQKPFTSSSSIPSRPSTTLSASTFKTSSSSSSSLKESTSSFSSSKPISTAAASSSSTPKPSTTSLSSSKPSSTPTSSAPAATSAVTKIPFLRGVNLGGWLVVEKWMNDDLFSGSFSSASDEWSISSISGAQSALQKHWDTFFTESDIASLAATGINALRIPIGFWAYDNANTPYLKGQDAYLEKAIGWARTHKMYVWVDCHGSPGSQNGFDNSGHAGSVDWQQQSNLDRSISVLKTMATKYGAQEYADVVVGLELTNEPISYGNNKFSVTQQWAQDAYKAVKAQVKNENLVVVMHDAFEGASQWLTVAKGLLGTGPKTFGVDSHLYQLYTDADNKLTQSQHITTACGWAAQLAIGNAIMPTYVGEWSAATNICVNPDGSTTAGTSCSTSGCQCQSADFDSWNPKMVEQVRRFVEAQMDVFESSSSGYFMWSAKGPGGWGFLNGIQKGVVPNPVTQRKYPGQCGGGKRREVRGSLGIKGEAF